MNRLYELIACPDVSLSGFADTAGGTSDFALTGSFSTAANGVLSGSITGLISASPTTANTFVLYLIDNTRAIAIETDNAQLTLGVLQLHP